MHTWGPCGGGERLGAIVCPSRERERERKRERDSERDSPLAFRMARMVLIMLVPIPFPCALGIRSMCRWEG